MQTSLKEPRNYAVSFNKETLKKDIIKTAEEAGFLEQVSFDDLTSHPTTIAGYGITDAYILNGTIYLGNQSITPESVSNLGTAAYANVTNSVSQGSLDLPTSGAVYSAIAAAVSSALHFRGISSTALTDGGTETATIGGVALVPQDGDVVIYDGFEFLWESNQWNKLGDDTSYALKTIQIAGDGTYITGGGDLTSSRTLDLSQAVKDALALASTAYQKPSGGIPASDLAEAYLPLTAGSSKALTGKLYMSAQTVELISSYNSGSFKIFSYNQSTLDVGGTDRTKGLRLNGSPIVLHNGGTNTIRFASTAFRPTDATNSLTLGDNTYKWSALYATTLYGNLDLSYLQNADDLKAIEALTGTGFAKRTADNTWALTNDIEATSLKTIAESDASFTYRKTPNTAVGDTLKIKRILGKTIVWNQLVQNGDFSQGTSGWQAVSAQMSVSDGTLSFTATAQYGRIQRSVAILNHTYYLATDISSANPVHIQVRNETQSSAYLDGVIVNGRNSFIFSVTGSIEVNTIRLRILNYATSAWNPVTVDNIQLIDLTVAGLDSLTVEEFEALYPLLYYNHDSGSLQSNKTAAIETTGFNQWDEEWENGTISNTTGENVPTTSVFRSINYISVFPGLTYYISAPVAGSTYIRLLFYDAEKHFLSASGFYNGMASFNMPANVWYMRFVVSKAYYGSTTYNHDICINLSDPSKNGTYEPYHKDTLTLNLTSLTSGGVAVCPEGLKAADYAGTVCDETDGQVLKNRVKRVNLGDLSWTADTTAGHERAVAPPLVPAQKPASATVVANLICDKYMADTNSHTYSHTSDKTISISQNDGGFYIYDSALVGLTSEQIKSAVNGIYVDYELATPVDYVLDTPIPMLVASDVNGTQRRLPEDTESSVQAPFRADFQYGVNPDDIIQDLNTKLQDLDNRYLPANALSNVVDITGTGLLTMPRAAISDSLLIPTLCRQQQGDVVLEWYEAKASLYVRENDLTLHIVLNGNDYSLNLN